VVAQEAVGDDGAGDCDTRLSREVVLLHFREVAARGVGRLVERVGPWGACGGWEEEDGRRGVSYGPPWAHYLGGYQDRLLGGPLGLLDLGCTTPVSVKRKDLSGEVLG
jgi:hypothetical protein